VRGLDGRVAVVTGGAEGIGRVIAMRLAEEGAALRIFDRAAASTSSSGRTWGSSPGRRTPKASGC
jgi:NAD(P)-dependent dehydrogenase (short-subunit alcohol dehydrogenase family)